MVLILYVIVEYFSINLDVFFIFNILISTSLVIALCLLFVKKDIFDKELVLIQVNNKKLANSFYVFSSPLFIFSIAGISVAVFDIWLLQETSGSVETGYYGLAYSIAAISAVFTVAMTPIITREFSKSFGDGDLQRIRKLFVRFLPMLYGISAFFGVFSAFESELIIQLFAGNDFENASICFTVLAFYPLHQTYGQLTSAIFFSTNQTRTYKNIGLIFSLIGVFVSTYLLSILNLGALGLAIKMVLLQIVSVNVLLYYNCKFLNLGFFVFFKNQVLVIILLYIGIALTSYFLSDFHSLMLTLLINGVIYFFYTVTLFLLFPALFGFSRQEIASFYLNFKKRFYIFYEK